MTPVFHIPRAAKKCLYDIEFTLVEAFEAFLFEDALEAMNNSFVFGIEKALIN